MSALFGSTLVGSTLVGDRVPAPATQLLGSAVARTAGHRSAARASDNAAAGRVRGTANEARFLRIGSYANRQVQRMRHAFEQAMVRRQIVVTASGLLAVRQAGMVGALVLALTVVRPGYRDRSLLLSRAPPDASTVCV